MQHNTTTMDQFCQYPILLLTKSQLRCSQRALELSAAPRVRVWTLPVSAVCFLHNTTSWSP